MPAWDEAEVELCREAHLAPEALLAGRARRLVREEQMQSALQERVGVERRTAGRRPQQPVRHKELELFEACRVERLGRPGVLRERELRGQHSRVLQALAAVAPQRDEEPAAQHGCDGEQHGDCVHCKSP